VDLDEEVSLDMQVAVKDAIFEGASSDYVLVSLLSLTAKELKTSRPLFPNPFDEPILYSRYFKPWVESAIITLRKIEERNTPE
jgi:hypothetical protein